MLCFIYNLLLFLVLDILQFVLKALVSGDCRVITDLEVDVVITSLTRVTLHRRSQTNHFKLNGRLLRSILIG